MNKILNESMRYVVSPGALAAAIATAALSIASVGCVDGPGAAPDQAGPVAPPDEAPSQPTVNLGNLARMPGTPRSFGELFQEAEQARAAQPGGVKSNATVGGCLGPGYIRAHNSNRFVSAELDYGGIGHDMLRARATEVHDWEIFQFCPLGGNRYAIVSDASLLLTSAEFGYTGTDNGMLRTRNTVVGPWETYIFTPRGGFYTLQTSGNNLYVSAEFGYPDGTNGMLRARASNFGPWEMFD
jgi:hypothetical protein